MSSRSIIHFAALLGAFWPQSNGVAEETKMNCARDKILQIAANHVATRFPQSINATKTLPPIMSDKGTMWEVSYELPPGVAGGVPVVLIDKETCSVVSSVHTQ